MSGAFHMSRDIFTNPIWDDPVKFRIFFYIIGNAVFSQDGIEHAGMHLDRGQYLRSLRNLREDLMYREGRGNAIKRYPLSTIQRKLKELENDGKINMKSTENGTLFTVVNYAKYQGLDNYRKSETEQLLNSDETMTEQRWNNNKNVKEGEQGRKNNNNSNVIPFAPEHNPFEKYHEMYGRFPTPKITSDIQAYEQDGMEQRMICLAIEKAAGNGSGFHYAKGILNNWKNKGLYTYEQAVNERKRREESEHGEHRESQDSGTQWIDTSLRNEL